MTAGIPANQDDYEGHNPVFEATGRKVGARSAHPLGRRVLIVGVLAIQGDYEAHRAVLERLGAEVKLVRKPEELDAVDALIIPGGESSTFLKFLEQRGFFQRLAEFVKAKPTFGTCAGAILLAKEVVGPEQRSLGVLDIRVRRNAYGRQMDSSIRQGELTAAGSKHPATKDGNQSLEMVFIRAPKIERVGKGVEVLASQGTDPVLVRQGKIMAATFHPELTADTRVHEAFLKMVGSESVR